MPEITNRGQVGMGVSIFLFLATLNSGRVKNVISPLNQQDKNVYFPELPLNIENITARPPQLIICKY